ncbi:tripartite tricarboxylate transporter substrate binding protein [Allopusillimonas ginsengisoli]|uniref:tripartite tricarboxylate transporter substrate binding protein n=1 Tax=Allopusillimonas ginsengisoli TaxID=453575 RepID=UPI0010C16F84|nr:tripartite tricarboxylate transporter substrate binding protein [Allopusillimonas ginsengisoli]
MRLHQLGASAFFAVAATLTTVCSAAGFPDKPVTMVVPYPPGGATDVIARMVSDKLSAKWDQTVIVTNRPGAGTVIAAESVARSAGDGYTLYMTTAAHTISKSLYKKLSYDPVKDFAPIDLVSTIPLVLVATQALPVKTLDELIKYGKAAKDGLTLASTGNGTPQHLTGELFKAKTHLDLIHVPYKGDAPMLTDLLGGQVQIAFVTLSAALPHITAGKLKAIALAHPNRVKAIENVPTFSESGMPGFNAATWFGIFAPASIPKDVQQKIYQDIHDVVAEPEMTRKLVEMGGEVNNSSPAEFQSFIDEEAAKWAEAVSLSGAQVN